MENPTTPELVDLSTLSLADLKAYTAKAEAKEKQAREKDRLKYEVERDEIIEIMVSQAKGVHEILEGFKKGLHDVFDDHQIRLQKYGGIRSNSKGGFSLAHSNGVLKAVRTRSTMPAWDERSMKAVELISDFMQDTVKKKDLKLYEILKSFIEKNDKGELEYSKVMILLTHKDKYDDERWLAGLQLIQESYSIALRGYGYEFF